MPEDADLKFKTETTSTRYRYGADHGSATLLGARCPRCDHVFVPRPINVSPTCPECGFKEKPAMTKDADLVARLRENIIADAFAQRRITDGVLAERLIQERHESADAIERLQAEVAAVRAQTLEEAAAVCEERAGTVSMFATSRDARDHNATVRGCAAAIRALKNKP